MFHGATRPDSFFILSEMTDKTRRVAPAQYEPQTEQSPPVCCREEEGAGPSLNVRQPILIYYYI